jgi:hypothetical protein
VNLDTDRRILLNWVIREKGYSGANWMGLKRLGRPSTMEKKCVSIKAIFKLQEWTNLNIYTKNLNRNDEMTTSALE